MFQLCVYRHMNIIRFLSSYIYCPYRAHAVILSAAGNSPTFRGFFIQGRLAADDSLGVGTFVTPPPGLVARLSSCSTPSVRERKLLGRPEPAAKSKWGPVITYTDLDAVEWNLILSLQSAITHTSRSDKDSVTVSWTAPSAGTGAVTFA